MSKVKYIIVLIIVLIAGLFLGWYLTRSNQQDVPPTNQVNQPKPNPEDHPIVKDDFEILLPKDWQETPPAMQGISMTAINLSPQDDFDDPAVKRINFRTNYNVTYDTLNTKTFSEYTTYIKGMTSQVAPGFKINNENDLTINALEAHTIEGTVSQQGLQFKVLIVIIKGNSDDVWTITFNSLEKNWERDADIFTKIAKSFVVKKK